MYIEELKSIINELNPYIDIDTETELIDSGILDSLSIVFLITQIEYKFEISVDEKLVTPENFRTVAHISEILKKCVTKK